jgi:hypothetical protein
MADDAPGQEEEVALTEEELDKEHVWVRLTKPIKSYGEEVTVIKMRLPTAADIFRLGNPVEFDPISDPPKITHNFQRLQVMIARLANIPSGSLEKMATKDLVACAWALTPHFLPGSAQD